jgi:hypothetical protein
MGQTLKQIIICTESMIVFIVNGIVINLQKCVQIGHFKYIVIFSYCVSLYKMGNVLRFLVNLV